MTHEQPYCAMLGAIRSSLGFIMMRNAVHLKCTSSPKSGFECGPSFYTAAATFVSDFITNLGRGPHSLTRRVLTLPSLTGGECCEEPADVSFTRKGLAKSPLSCRLKVSGYLELIVRRIRLTSGLDDAIYFTPPTMAGDNRQYILLSTSEHIKAVTPMGRYATRRSPDGERLISPP